MKNAKPSTATSKRPKVEASTIALATSDQLAAVDPTIKDIHVDPTTTMNPTANAETDDPTVTPHLSLRAMMETFMTTQAAHGQLINELLTKVVAPRADFVEYRSVFPPPPPFDP